jgi:hypothetical protein
MPLPSGPSSAGWCSFTSFIESHLPWHVRDKSYLQAPRHMHGTTTLRCRGAKVENQVVAESSFLFRFTRCCATNIVASPYSKWENRRHPYCFFHLLTRSPHHRPGNSQHHSPWKVDKRSITKLLG